MYFSFLIISTYSSEFKALSLILYIRIVLSFYLSQLIIFAIFHKILLQNQLGGDILTSEEKAYIAGIIDGEGSIMLISFHKNHLPSPIVSISSTTLDLLKWIKSTIGKGTIINKKNYNVEKHKASYTYYLKYNDAINLLKDVEPYLIIKSKKKRAQMIINRYKEITPRNGRYSAKMLNLKEQFYKEFMELK